MRWSTAQSFLVRAAVLGALIKTIPVAEAGIRPSFNLDYAAWSATDIVLVETTRDPGVFGVLEVWRGELRSGDRVMLSELKPDPKSVPLSTLLTDENSVLSDDRNTHIPKQPFGSRILLFVKRDPPIFSGSRAKWNPADSLGDMKASAVWIEGARLFCFVQIINPGPSRLVPCTIFAHNMQQEMSQPALRGRVSEVLALRSRFDDTVRVVDDVERAMRLREFIVSDVFPARLDAMKELKKCGPRAEAVVEQMISDPDYADFRDELISTSVAVGGRSAGPMLIAVLEEELDSGSEKPRHFASGGGTRI